MLDKLEFPLDYEEINHVEYADLVTDEEIPDGNFIYHVDSSGNEIIFIIVREGEILFLPFLSMVDVECFTTGLVDIESILYQEYQNENFENFNDYGITLYDNFKKFIEMRYPKKYSEIFENDKEE